jgi:hypothetical protein
MPLSCLLVVIVLHLIIVLSLSWSLNDDEVSSPHHLVIAACAHDDVIDQCDEPE